MLTPRAMATDPQLTAELETLALREIATEWHAVNRDYFGSALRRPHFLLTASTTHLGRYDGRSGSIEFARALVFDRPWGMVVEVLKHETAHQYVYEILGASDESAHGGTFQRVCARLGIDAAAVGLPQTGEPIATERSRALDRIAKLLALAGSSNQHEAEAAAAQAQRLMLKYNLEHVQSAATRNYGFRHLGRPTGRLTASDHYLAAILSSHFFVDVIWVSVYRPLEAKYGRVLEICGTPENLEIASYVYSFLSHTAERLWDAHKQANQVRGNRDRRTFLAGVMSGFRTKLKTQAQGQRSEGLVWIKDARLESYMHARHPRIRHGRGSSVRRNDAFTQGQRAGEGIVLQKGMRSGVEARGLRLTSGTN